MSITIFILLFIFIIPGLFIIISSETDNRYIFLVGCLVFCISSIYCLYADNSREENFNKVTYYNSKDVGFQFLKVGENRIINLNQKLSCVIREGDLVFEKRFSQPDCFLIFNDKFVYDYKIVRKENIKE